MITAILFTALFSTAPIDLVDGEYQIMLSNQTAIYAATNYTGVEIKLEPTVFNGFIYHDENNNIVINSYCYESCQSFTTRSEDTINIKIVSVIKGAVGQNCYVYSNISVALVEDGFVGKMDKLIDFVQCGDANYNYTIYGDISGFLWSD